MMAKELTPKQKRFADNYIATCNATQSAIDAGYSARTAKSVGSENLTKPDVKAYIDKQMAVISSHKIMDAEEAVELLTGIARGDTKETIFVSTGTKVYEKEKEADLKTRILAVKEILKRYPDNDKLLEQQIRKLTAEADLREAEAKRYAESDNGVEDAVSELLDKIDGEVDDA